MNAKLVRRTENTCCRCGQVDKMECVVEEDAKYLCRKCFKLLKARFESENPGQTLDIKDEVEQ